MFFRRNKPIENTPKVIKKNTIPILVLDKQWRNMFSKNMNKTMEYLSKELTELIKEEKRLKTEIKQYQGKKRILMNKIIHSSHRLNTQGANTEITDIENAKEEINILNDKIDETREKIIEYPKKIENVNMELLKETTNFIYSEINTIQNRLKKVDDEIIILRNKLGDYRDEKENLEKRNQSLYSLIHSIVGPEAIEKFDSKFFQD